VVCGFGHACSEYVVYSATIQAYPRAGRRPAESAQIVIIAYLGGKLLDSEAEACSCAVPVVLLYSDGVACLRVVVDSTIRCTSF
jgi:hypothetical protein